MSHLFRRVLAAGAVLTLTACAHVRHESSAPQLRALTPGMEWVYAAEATLTPPGGAPPQALTGAMTISIEERPFRGGNALTLVWREKLVPVDGGAAAPGANTMGAMLGDKGPVPQDGLFYFRQDATGALYILGDNGGPDRSERVALGEGGLIIPGRWRVGGGYREPVRWAGGGQTDNWLEIAALDTVVTPLGSFQAWRAPNGSTSTDGQTVRGTDWWVPSLGQPAQFEARIDMPDGGRMELRAVITATNVKR